MTDGLDLLSSKLSTPGCSYVGDPQVSLSALDARVNQPSLMTGWKQGHCAGLRLLSSSHFEVQLLIALPTTDIKTGGGFTDMSNFKQLMPVVTSARRLLLLFLVMVGAVTSLPERF